MNTPEPPLQHGRAVVVGAGLAGLLAADALSKRFAEVLVVDRGPAVPPLGPCLDHPPGPQTLLLLPAARELLEERFPGMGAALAVLGARSSGSGAVTRALAGPGGGFVEGLGDVLCVSRCLMRRLLFQRLRQCEHIRFAWQSRVITPRLDEHGRQIVGVRLTSQPGHRPPRELDCALLVDASGRTADSLRWLIEAGLAAPSCSRIDSTMHVASLRLAFDPGARPRQLGRQVMPLARRPLGALLLAQEGGDYALNLIAVDHTGAPSDAAGCLAFAKALGDPAITEAISLGRALGEPQLGVSRGSVRRHFEQLPQPLNNLFVVGDALCTLGPLHVYGASVAVQQADALAACLDLPPQQRCRRYFAEAARIVEQPWQLAAAEDLRCAPHSGWRVARLQPLRIWLSALRVLAARDRAIADRLSRVADLRAPLRELVGRASLRGLIAALLARCRLGRRGRAQRPRVASSG